MATNEEMLVSAFRFLSDIFFNLANMLNYVNQAWLTFRSKTIKKNPFGSHFEFE